MSALYYCENYKYKYSFYFKEVVFGYFLKYTLLFLKRIMKIVRYNIDEFTKLNVNYLML